jgi:asparagine synthase (glutamine-hydrolysing)
MCGISGFAGSPRDAQPAEAIIRAMCRAIRHRGPDDEGYYTDPAVALGSRRLSIIDVEGGRQPISNEDGTIWVVFNGEIYNFLQLRAMLAARGHRFRTASDTEIIVHLFEEDGPQAVERLDGMFAFAIWDRPRRRLVLARDRMGKKPLYYALAGRELIFASEIKALLVHPRVDRRMSIPALARYLIHDYVPVPWSIFHGINKLPPGHILVFEDGVLRVRAYWDLPAAAGASDASEDEQTRRLHLLLEEAVRRRLVADVPLGAFLSGGIDSSAVVALMARNTSCRVKTFNIGFVEKSFDEARYARRVAARLGTDHHEDVVMPKAVIDLAGRVGALLDEPLADASFIPTYLLSRFTRQHVTVALSGDGGDEMFGGYPTYQAHRIARLLDGVPRPILAGVRAAADRLPVSYANFSLDFKIKKFMAGLGHPLALRHARWLGSFVPEDLPELLTPDAWAAVESDDVFSEVRHHARAAGDRNWLDTALYLDAKLYLQDDVLVKVDRASMACSLEVRCPFLDTAVVDFASRLPADQKLRGFTTKYLLKRSLRDLLPGEILHRPKKGFGIPLGFWIRNDLRELFVDALDPARMARQGLFRPHAVHRLLEEHLAGRHDHRKRLWNLFVFQKWYAAYVESPAPADGGRAYEPSTFTPAPRHRPPASRYDALRA